MLLVFSIVLLYWHTTTEFETTRQNPSQSISDTKFGGTAGIKPDAAGSGSANANHIAAPIPEIENFFAVLACYLPVLDGFKNY